MGRFLLKSFIICAVVAALGYVWNWVFFLFILIAPIVIIGIMDLSQTKHSIIYNFPVIGRMRWWARLQAKIRCQYF